MISVKAHIEGVTSALSALEKEVVPRAAQQALNRAGDTVRSRTVKELATEMALRRQSDLKGIITVKKAARGNLSVSVTVTSKSLGIEASKKTLVRQTRKKGRKVFKITYKGEAIDQAFRPDNLGQLSGKGVFTPIVGQRYATGNRAMSRKFSFTTVQEMAHAKIDEIQEKVGVDRFAVEFDRSLANEIRKIGLA